jgi:ATPase
MPSEKILIPDTSVIVDGRITKLIKKTKGSIKIIVPEAVVAELENQANNGRDSGFKGLEELTLLRDLKDKGVIEIEFIGKRPEKSRLKDIDDLIRNTALDFGGTLVTSDQVQSRVAVAKGIQVMFLKSKKRSKRLKILSFFDPETMSVHLKEKVPPLAKRGKPGDIRLVQLNKSPLKKSYLKKMSVEILEYTKSDPEGFVEIERNGATVVQIKQMRISIARPPFSDGYEITAVRPVAYVNLYDYTMPDKLLKRLDEKAEGVFIAGPPGAGKSTFSQALAEFYRNKGKIVKTMESPRDLVVPPEITQYSPLEGSMEKTADILLLVRPDYTIYDELRKTKDFQIFADMRLSGVGMVGVVHAAKPIDAIQRLIKRVELGMIPQIIDTVIFIKDGWINKVYNIEFSVKVPYGMTESDLARPIIEVQDFVSNRTEYEIYTFGDETVVMEVKNRPSSPTSRLASEMILNKLSRIVPKSRAKVEITNNKAILRVDDRFIPKIIGRGGRRVERLEKDLGLKIDVQPLNSDSTLKKTPLSMNIEESPRYIHFTFDKGDLGRTVNINVEGEFIFMATIGRKSEIKMGKHNEVGERIMAALEAGEEITAEEV